MRLLSAILSVLAATTVVGGLSFLIAVSLIYSFPAFVPTMLALALGMSIPALLLTLGMETR